MANNIWKDTTSYSAADKERKPRVWTMDNGKLRISVLNSHRQNPGVWVMHCPQLALNCVELRIADSATEREAQEQALRFVRSRLNTLLLTLKN